MYAVMLRAPNALVEDEMDEKNKIIDMQKYEIKRLRNQLTDTELNGSRPPSSTRLPPMQAVESVG